MPGSIYNEIIKRRPFLGIEKDKQPMGNLPGIVPPDWFDAGPLYELFVRNFSPAGNFEGVRQKIPYLQDLGIKTVWLMPVHPIGREGRKGSLGCPYAIADHRAINPEYGTEDEFRELVRSLHSAGMRLIIDLVINHGARDHHLTRSLPRVFAHDHRGQFTRKIADWSDVIDFDYSCPDIRRYMFEVMTCWIEKFDIDGYRCDVAGMVPLDFWEDAVQKILKIKPDLFMLAEWQRPIMHRKAFHSTYDWITYFILKEISRGKRPAEDILHWIVQRNALLPRSARPLNFTENHDFPRTRKVFGTNSFYPYASMIFTMPGIPLLYNGQEQGAGQAVSLFDRDPLAWGDTNPEIYDFYRKLIRLRRENKAMATSQLLVLKNDRPEKVITFIKTAADNRLLIMINFGSRRQKLGIAIPAQDHNRNWQNLLNTGMIRKGKELRNVDLGPYEFLFWKEVPRGDAQMI